MPMSWATRYSTGIWGMCRRMMEFEIFDIKDATEYDANVFAANLLIDEQGGAGDGA